MVYFIADTHFNDGDILRYENRPFDDVEDMNTHMIRQWNRVIKDTDEVYVVGDFCKYLKDGQEQEILQRLRGQKYLIKGNHDTQSNRYYRCSGFDEVYDHSIILCNYWIVSHEPIYVNEYMPYANIFGHVHSSRIYNDFSSHHFCVSAERISYRPISFDDIAAKVKQDHEERRSHDRTN